MQPAEDEAARIVAAAKEEAAALLNDAELRKAELVTEIADKEGDLAELDNQLEDVKLDIEDEQDRLECLRQRADGVARDIGELQPIATEVRGWEAAGKAERGAILDNIVVKCDGLASQGNRALMTCCAMRCGRRMRGTATTLHRRGRIADGLDDVL